jgi:hypothetical protein
VHPQPGSHYDRSSRQSGFEFPVPGFHLLPLCVFSLSIAMRRGKMGLLTGHQLAMGSYNLDHTRRTLLLPHPDRHTLPVVIVDDIQRTECLCDFDRDLICKSKIMGF